MIDFRYGLFVNVFINVNVDVDVNVMLMRSFLIGGMMPYNFNAMSSSGRFNLLELIRSGRKPTIVSAPHPRLVPVLASLMTMCLQINAQDRPCAAAITKAIRTSCQELGISLPIEGTVTAQDGHDYAVGGASLKSNSNTVDVDDDVNIMDGFDEMTSQIDNLGTSLKLFLLSSRAHDSTVTSLEVQSENNGSDNAFLAVYGSKALLYNFKQQQPASVYQGQSVVGVDDSDWEGSGDLHGGDNDTLALVDTTAGGGTLGTVVFHIDATKSMSHLNRMVLTRQVLHRIIPKLARQGYRIVVNAWSVRQPDMIRTRTVKINPELLATEKKVELASFLDKHVFDIFDVPEGQTDLFGACFRLFRQCKELLREGPVHTFLLTDGNHNVLTKPTHTPSSVGETYFGCVSGAINKKGELVWVAAPTASTPIDPAVAYEFLRDELTSLVNDISIDGQNEANRRQFSITFVGIGDADSNRLAAFALVLGPQATYYGVTEVEHSDLVFTNITSGSAASTISLMFGQPQRQREFSYIVEDNGVIEGTTSIDNPALVQQLHNSPSVALSLGQQTYLFVATETNATWSGNASIDVNRIVGDFVLALQRIRELPYVVVANNVTAVFKQLVLDKKMLQAIKGSYYTRNLRYAFYL